MEESPFLRVLQDILLLKRRRPLEEWLLGKAVEGAARAAVEEKTQRHDILEVVEDVKQRAGLALGLPNKASATEVQVALCKRGRKDLAKVFEAHNKGRRVIAHPVSKLSAEVEVVLGKPVADVVKAGNGTEGSDQSDVAVVDENIAGDESSGVEYTSNDDLGDSEVTTLAGSDEAKTSVSMRCCRCGLLEDRLDVLCDKIEALVRHSHERIGMGELACYGEASAVEGTEAGGISAVAFSTAQNPRESQANNEQLDASADHLHEVIPMSEIPQGLVRIIWHSSDGSSEEIAKMNIMAKLFIVNGVQKRAMRDLIEPPVLGNAGQAILKFGPFDWCEVSHVIEHGGAFESYVTDEGIG